VTLSSYGCSGSSDRGSIDAQASSESVEGTLSGDSGTPNGGAGITDMESGSERPFDDVDGESNGPPIVDSQLSTPVVPDPPSLGTIRVNFDITVPAYMSDELQVRLQWGDIDTNATWEGDESWAISEDFPVNTESLLVVTFNDGNGAITLGSFEANYKADADALESYQITADQFNTSQWDNDSDGVSNLDELLASADPGLSNTNSGSGGTLLPVEATIELIADKTFRIRWQPSPAADYYRVLENADGVSGYTPITGELDASTEFFDHRVALHKRVNARYMVEACNTGGCTLSVQQLIEGPLVSAIGYFKASNPGPSDQFGSDVSLSADGTTMAVGAPAEGSGASVINGNQDDDTATNAGAVYVFVYSNNRWLQQAYLKASNAGAGDNFGTTLSLSADGNTLAVSAPSEESAATGVNGDQSDNTVSRFRGSGTGAVYVFARNGESWQQEAYLKSSNNKADGIGFAAGFGRSLELSSDGNTLAVSALGEDSNSTGLNGKQSDVSAIDSGAVYIFLRSDETWQQQAYIKAATSRSRFFGKSVSLSKDGNTLAIGVNDFVTLQTSGVTNRGADARDFYGAVYIFVRIDGNWQSQAFLRPEENASWSGFGSEIDLADDGHTLAISGAGVVYLFERIERLWQQQAIAKPSNDSGGFGGSLSLSGDGSTLAVGAPAESGASSGLQGYQGSEIVLGESGAVYVFGRGDGSWEQLAYVKASNSRNSIRFGTTVSLGANGDTMAVGAIWEGSPASGINGNQSYDEFSRTGAIYLY